ncbi:MAG TPA: circularly permuted type 2 ATP-grasp protein, partial [Paracoccaceae bacterium]|nr:circularly permuted type 2 ATP-grasp protein [Paracoccaceae bacterium]
MTLNTEQGRLAQPVIYRPLPGIPDEMMSERGEVRPAWKPLICALARMRPEEIDQRFSRADQYLRDAGVFYRVYGESGANERDWPLSHLPLLIEETEWNRIAEGLVQRIELLERVLADIYGPGRLVAEGHLPPSLIAASPEFLRPLVGVTPAGGHFLHFCCFELGRGADGGWRVLGDRTQAPSGAGFALENRVATTRAFSDIYSEMHVHRLAGFFRTFRDAMQGLRRTSEGRVAILTPGPLNETYYEHAYIARYLGFMLLQGEDLLIVDGRAMVRTVAGLRPIDVIWRRLDSIFADPLELNQDSRLGTPGLVSAVRQGTVAMVNALGSGILEMRALLAFLPRLAPVLIGEDLKLPSIATWW